ncbi:hypothetical protein [Ralstonia wenshanensis]|uniref:hypothetical protein n=1 Tax=Ralstonia wenshanensis TaxID=2842456 RepID=UPI003D967EA2
MSDFYVISVHHTQKQNRYILLWRPENNGYTFRTSTAGRYDEETVRAHLGYYNAGVNIAVQAHVVDAMTVMTTPADQFDGADGPAVLNTAANWRRLLKAVIAPPQYKPRPAVIYFGRNADGRRREAA